MILKGRLKINVFGRRGDVFSSQDVPGTSCQWDD